MAAETIQLEIVTPSGVKLRERVSDVTAPSVGGEFGVLPGHLPMLAALRTGIVTYHQGGEERKVAVHHGFVEVANDHALLLTGRGVGRGGGGGGGGRRRRGEGDGGRGRGQGGLT